MAESDSGDGRSVRPYPALPGMSVASRRVRLLLWGSLALNLLFIGMIAGAIFSHGGGARIGIERELAFGPFTDALTREDRAALRGALVARVPDLRSFRQERREEFAGMIAELRREPFDRARLDAAFDDLHERIETRMEIGRILLADRIAAMSPTERAAFADRLVDRLDRPDGARGP